MARGDAQDALAARAVVGVARSVANACRDCGWEYALTPAPLGPRALLAAIEKSRAECVFNLAEAWAGEARLEAAVAWLLEMERVAYTGSPPLALSLALQKPLAKAVLQSRGVPVPEGCLLETGDEPLPKLPFPWIVKPAAQDASHGISSESVVNSVEAARARARTLIETYGEPAMVEEFVAGREFNVSLLGNGEVLPLSEIDFSGFPADRHPLVTYEAKWVEESPEYRATPPIEPRDLAPDLAERIAKVARDAYRILGLRDYGRVDLRLHPTRGPLVLEVNPNPDLSPDAGLARAAERRGWSYARLIGSIVESALDRAARH